MMIKCKSMNYMGSDHRVIIPFALILCTILMLIDVTRENEANVKVDGDILIGGLLSIHKKFDGKTSKCSHFNWNQMMNVIGMIYAVEKVNQNQYLLPNIALGYDIRDGCTNNDQIIRQMLDVLFDVKDQESAQGDSRNRLLSNDSDTNSVQVQMIDELVNDKLIGFVDANVDKASGDIQVIAKSLNLPQVSCATTSAQFSNSKLFKTFYRTIPPDFQVLPIALSITNHFNWTFISLITYTTDAANPMHQRAAGTFTASGICLDVKEKLSRSSNITKAAINIKQSAAPVVVIISDTTNLLKLLQQFEKQKITGKTLVTSGGWDATILNLSPQLIGGMIGISIKQRPSPGFLQYLEQAPLCQILKPFLIDIVQEYGKNIGNGTLVDFMHTCSLFMNHTIQSESTFRNFSYDVAYMIDAVYALAHATHMSFNCNQSYCYSLPINQPSFRKKFLQDLLRISFTGATSELFQFDAVGDPKFTKYHIVNSKPISDDHHQYIPVVIGSWQANHPIALSINDSKVGFGPYANISYTSIPQLCSLPCQPGSYYKLIAGKLCCWKCIPCPLNTVSNQTQSSICDPCPSGSSSNSNQTKCLLTQPLLLRYDSIQNIIMFIYLAIAVAITIFVWIVLIKYRHTPVVKASNFILSQMYIVSILMCLSTAVLFSGPVNNFLCVFTFLLFCTSLCFVMSIILIKTIRISRVFNAEFSKSCTSKFILHRYGSAAAAILITLPEVIICVVANDLDPFTVHRRIISQNIVYLQCRSSTVIGYFIALGYFSVISIICTYMAFKTRKLPDNFGEAKYISFTKYIALVALIAIIPAYFGTSGPFQAAIASFGMITLSVSILLCMFAQRLYVILREPEMNTKENVMIDVANYSFNSVGSSKMDRRNCIHTGSVHTNASMNVSTPETPTVNSKFIEAKSSHDHNYLLQS